MTFSQSGMIDTARARRLAAALAADDRDGFINVVAEAEYDGGLRGLVLALAVRCAQMAAELYGPDAQVALDGWALDASWVAEHGF